MSSAGVKTSIESMSAERVKESSAFKNAAALILGNQKISKEEMEFQF